MTWTIAYSVIAERDLLDIPWRLAMRMDAAVMAFAEGRKGEASLERVSPTDPCRLRLRLPGASAWLWLDVGQRVVYVARVRRNT